MGITTAGKPIPIKVDSIGRPIFSLGGTVYPEVANFSALPPAASHTGEIYVALAGEGIYIVARKQAGLYLSNGSIWNRLGNNPAFFLDTNFQIVNGVDNTKIVKEDLSGITTGTTRTYIRPDKSGTYAMLDDAFTAATLTTVGNGLNTIETIAVADNSALILEVSYIGFRTDATGGRAGYKRDAVIYREAAGSATFQGSINTGFTRESVPQYNATIIVSGNNALIQVAGQTGHTVNWKVLYKITVVS